MKVLKKVIPYQVRRALPILGIAMGGMFMSSCHDDDEPKIKQHDTTYTWGIDNFYNNTKLNAQIRASADSASVRYVILKSDGKSWGGAFNENDFHYQVIEPFIRAGGEENRHKFKGAGTIKYVTIKYPEDNKWLTDFGYDIIPCPPVPPQHNIQNQR